MCIAGARQKESSMRNWGGKLLEKKAIALLKPLSQKKGVNRNKKKIRVEVQKGQDVGRENSNVLTTLTSILPLISFIICRDGRKMSKRLKNYPDPELVISSEGADALRLVDSALAAAA